jgi:hypothetical protein
LVYPFDQWCENVLQVTACAKHAGLDRIDRDTGDIARFREGEAFAIAQVQEYPILRSESREGRHNQLLLFSAQGVAFRIIRARELETLLLLVEGLCSAGRGAAQAF